MAVTDLTNTTWVINSLTCPAGYGQFSINGIYSRGGETYDVDANLIYIGYTIGTPPIFAPAPTANSVIIMGSMNIVEVGDVVEFTGGTDVTNASLISWLEANATQQTTSTGKTQIGNRAITKKMFGTREITKEVVNGVVVYEKSAPSSYSVHIDCTLGGGATFYDGQDTSGILLGTLAYFESDDYTITSGYIFATGDGYFMKDSTNVGNPVQITQDGTYGYTGGVND